MKHAIVRSKMKKGSALRNDLLLRSHVPETDWLREKSFERMIAEYGTVYVKPDIGRQGEGIVRVRKTDARYAEISSKLGTAVCPLHRAYAALRGMLKPDKSYIVQQGIDRATYHGRPFDVRVVMQKPLGRWRATLMCARVAPKPTSVVTNVAQGAVDHNLYRLLQQTDQALDPAEVVRDLLDLSHQSAQVLSGRFPLLEIGLDLAVDQEGKVWILEANTKPDNEGLERIDEKLYRKYRLAKQMMSKQTGSSRG